MSATRNFVAVVKVLSFIEWNFWSKICYFKAKNCLSFERLFFIPHSVIRFSVNFNLFLITFMWSVSNCENHARFNEEFDVLAIFRSTENSMVFSIMFLVLERKSSHIGGKGDDIETSHNQFNGCIGFIFFCISSTFSRSLSLYLFLPLLIFPPYSMAVYLCICSGQSNCVSFFLAAYHYTIG